MDTPKQALMKHCASVLRKRATGKAQDGINPKLLDHLSRKDLLTILEKKLDGEVHATNNLLELENHQLLELIGNEMYIISHLTDRWSKEEAQEPKKSTTITTAKKPSDKA